MGKSKEETENEKLQKELDKKENNKFLDKVIIQMIISVTLFTLLWTIMNAFNLTIQTEVIVGYFAFWGAEGGASCLIHLKKNKKMKQENSYNDMDYGYIQPEPSKRYYQDEEEIYNEPEQPDEGEIK